MGKKTGSGSGRNNSDHVSESLETIFGLIPKFIDGDPGSGMEKNRIRDLRNITLNEAKRRNMKI